MAIRGTVTMLDGTVVTTRDYSTIDEAMGTVNGNGLLVNNNDGTYNYYLPRHVTKVVLTEVPDPPAV